MTENQLRAIEQNIQEKQLEISQYMQEVTTETDAAISHRLQTLYKEYSQLQTQIAILRSNAQACENIKNGVVYEHLPTITPPLQRQDVIKHSKPIKPAKEPKPAKQKKDIEQTLGKNVMGIVASILVFIALTLFAIVVLPNMTDTIKMIGMCAISAAITGFGVFLMKKDPNNGFNASIAGCGIGAIFISLLTMRIYFNAIGDYTLYFLLLWWTVAIAYFSRNKHKMFVVIGEVGITISSLMGLFNTFMSASDDIVKASALLIFTMVASAALYIFNNTGDLKEDKIMHIFHALRSLIIIMTYEGICTSGDGITRPLIILLMMVGLGMFALERSIESKSKHFLLSVYAIAIFFVTKAFIYDWMPGDEQSHLLTLTIIGGLIMNAFIFMYKEFSIPCAISHLILFFTVGNFSAEGQGILVFLLPLLLFVVPAYMIAYWNEIPYFKFVSFAAIPLFTFFFACPQIDCNTYPMLFTLTSIGLAIAFAVLFKESKTMNTLVYIFSMFVFPFVLGFGISETDTLVVSEFATPITYWITTAVFVFLSKKEQLKQLKGMRIINNVLMMILVSVGAVVVHFEPWAGEYYGTPTGDLIDRMSIVAMFVSVIVLVGLNVLKTMDILKQDKGKGIYMCVAYVISVWSLILKISDVNYIFSLAMLLLAIFTIVFGFKVQIEDQQGNKGMRIFGLTLSMITTIKLLMLDIEHNNMVETAGYLLLAGILCFVISFIYNKLDKNLNKE